MDDGRVERVRRIRNVRRLGQRGQRVESHRPHEQQAHATATDLLDIQYDAYGPRPATSVRRVEPAQQVQRAEWHHGGVLDVWIRDTGEWLGRVRDRDGRITWVPGPDLRPTDQTT